VLTYCVIGIVVVTLLAITKVTDVVFL